MRLVRINVQVTHFDLRSRPGHPRFTLEDVRVVILLSEGDRLLARFGNAGSKDDLGSFIRLEANAATQTENRIEHGADRIRKRAILDDRNRVCGRVPPAEKTRTVSFKLNPADRIAAGRQHVHAPNGLVLCRTRTPMGQQRVVRRVKFSFNEQVAERGMGEVVSAWGQHDFGIAGQFDFARAIRIIRQRNAAHLGIVFGRNNHFHVGNDAGVTPPKIGFVLRKRYFIALRFRSDRLMPGGPDCAAAQVADINKGAPVIASDVFAPARDGASPTDVNNRRRRS